MIDSDPNKQGTKFLMWDVFNESVLINGSTIDVVIISSKAFQEEIYNKIAKHKKNIMIVKCYN